MKVFLDTNVLVSGLATRGLCSDVAKEALPWHELVISAQLLSELTRALRNKIGVPTGFVTETIEMLKQDAHLSRPTCLADVPLLDRSDLSFLSSTMNGKDDVFGTGEKELLALGGMAALESVSPGGSGKDRRPNQRLQDAASRAREP